MALLQKVILTSKVKVMSGLGVVGVTGASVPAAILSAETSRKGSSLFKDISSSLSELTKDIPSKFEGIDGSLKEQFTTAWGKLVNEWAGTENEIAKQYQNGKTEVENVVDVVKKNAEEVNYHLFGFGKFIKRMIHYIPTIASESVLEYMDTENQKNLMSFQKLYAIGSHNNMGAALKQLKDVADRYPQKFAEMSGRDAIGLISIIRSLRHKAAGATDAAGTQGVDMIGSWLGVVTRNASDILSSPNENYCTSTKLFIHLFVGKRSIKNMKEKLIKLETVINAIKGELASIDGFESLLATFQIQINNLKAVVENPTWADPCPVPDDPNAQQTVAKGSKGTGAKGKVQGTTAQQGKGQSSGKPQGSGQNQGPQSKP